MKQVAIKELCAPFLNFKIFRPQREQQFAEELSRIKEELLETKQVCTAVFQLQTECFVIRPSAVGTQCYRRNEADKSGAAG